MQIEATDPIMDFFPAEHPRAQQIEALEFIEAAVRDGIPDIVVVAPTGSGKSIAGAAAALWSTSYTVDGYMPGGYYLVTQKMLQDQLEADFPRYVPEYRTSAASLKSSGEYTCQQYLTCMAGGMASQADKKNEKGKKCAQRVEKTCPYQLARWRFAMSHVAVTNYPYMFTEHMYVGELKPRNFLVLDECHTLSEQITNFVEVLISHETVEKWAPDCLPVPSLPTVDDFIDWLTGEYIVSCQVRLEMLHENIIGAQEPNRKMQSEFNSLKNHVSRLSYSIADMQESPESWVYWQEKTEKGITCTAKTLSAAPFMPIMVQEMGATRLYMSAYPGPKDVFCRDLGLDPAKVAWLELDSTFPAKHRQIHMTTVGSMSRNNFDETMPKLLKMCATILDTHAHEKGVIHTHTYAIGKKIYDYLSRGEHADRLLFATKASERASLFTEHRSSKTPTVIISPSMDEGYSFDNDLARFQILAKCPFLYLGDRQVKARMEQDRDWYVMQTVMSFIQACGRIVRSETDHGISYCLDSDFIRLLDDNPTFFPAWFKKAVVFYDR